MNAQNKVEAATLHSAMALAFPEIEGATKDSSNPHFKSKYADLASVIAAIKPALAKQGLFFSQTSHPCEGGVSVETRVHHASGECLSFGALFVPATKHDAQGFGSALTYCRRYSLMTAFGVAPEDDDGNAAARSAPAAQQAPPTARMATDDQCALILTLAPAAGKTVQQVLEAHELSALPELTEDKAAKTIKRLQELAKELVDA